MKKFTLVSLARTKKSATSALMGLAILFVTLNFVSATLSIKVYSSNSNSSEGIGLQNNDTGDNNIPFGNTALQDNETAPRILLEDDNFPSVLNLPNTATHPSSFPVHGCTSNAVSIFPFDQKSSSSFNNDDSSYDGETSLYHRDGSPNLLAQAPDIPPPPAGLFEGTNGSPSTITCHFYRPGATSGNNPDAVATKNISYTPLHKRTRSEVTSTYGITNGNDLDAFPSIWDDSLDGSE